VRWKLFVIFWVAIRQVLGSNDPVQARALNLGERERYNTKLSSGRLDVEVMGRAKALARLDDVVVDDASPRAEIHIVSQ
jgi:hypothetical protein